MKFITILMLLVAMDSFAQNLKCSQNGTAILFVNGIDTNSIEAIRNARIVWSIAKSNISSIDSKSLKIDDYFYNKTSGQRKDFLESGVQLLLQEPSLSSVNPYKILSNYLRFGSIPTGVANDIVKESVQAKLKELSLPFYLNIPVLQETAGLAQLIGGYLTANRKVILTSHSQGNFFANGAYLALNETSVNNKLKFFGNLQVASPTSSVLAKGAYMTLVQDFITLVPNSMGGNFSQPDLVVESTKQDREQHSFILTYTNQSVFGESLRPDGYAGTMDYIFKSSLIEVAEKLDTNCSTGCGGLPGNTLENGAFVAETAIVEEGANLGGNVEICETAKVRSGASISAVRGNARIGGNSEIQAGTFINADSGIINILNSTLQGSFTITRTGTDISKAKIDISDSIVFGNIYCESILFATGSCSINISGSTLINAQGGVVARGPMKNAVINISGSTISGVVSSDAIFEDSILNVFGQNICSGSSYSALNGVVTTNINEVC